MTALHLHAQLQSINSIPVGVCEVYTLESLIESQWPSTADRGMIFLNFFVVVVLVVLFCCLLSWLLFFACITCKCHVACGVLIICSALTAIHN